MPRSTRYVYALDVRTGKPIPTFGDNGRIDLHRDLGRDPERQSVVLTSPGVVHKDLLILGGRVSEELPASPGDIRAYNARTGALQWSFHTIPHPGESRLRDLVEGFVARDRRRQQLARHGARRGARHCLCADGIRGGRLLRRQPASATTSTRTPCSRSTPTQENSSGTFSSCGTTSGIAMRQRRQASSPSGTTARRLTPSRRRPSTATCSCSIA